MSIITLMTDFGADSPYVAVMKAAIFERMPLVTVVDLTHSIEPQNVLQGAFVWDDFAASFPKHTIHLGVVDPGVGSDRKLIAAQCDGHFFVCPDNGLITFLIDRSRDANVIELTESLYWRPMVSSTFHGRDVMAPVAAAIASGVPFEELGRPYGSQSERLSQQLPLSRESKPPQESNLSQQSPLPVRLAVSQARFSAQTIEAEIVSVDHFGNLFLNVRCDDIPDTCMQRLKQQSALSLLIGKQTFDCTFVSTYSHAKHGSIVLLGNSCGRLEIASVNGNAAEQLHASVGTAVTFFLP